MLLRRHLGDASDARPTFASQRLAGATLIADLSGFTALAERLATRGAEGVEELSRLVNRWFGAMVDVIEAHGGDVIRFAGDAPIVVFLAAPAEVGLGPAVARARMCGRALCEVMRTQWTPDAPVGIRVGIGAGEAVAIVAGGVDDHWEFIVAGAPLADMSDAQRAATPGDVHLSRSALEFGVTSHDVTEPIARLERPPVREDLARLFVPRAVASLVDGGSAGWAAELRTTTVLFLSIQDLDLDTPDGPRRLHDALRSLQTAVFKHGGQVTQFLVDDKGITLMASWGVAGHRHEDDAARAVRAAVVGRSALHALGLAARCGLSTGRVFCGWRGNEARREYALIGAVVNRAARLMTSTADDIRVDASTRFAAERVISFEPTDAVTLKGTDGPVLTFRPRVDDAAGRTPRQAVPALTEMVGRVAERGVLHDALTSLGSGQSHTLAIRGDAGLGKSTLVEDFLRAARAAGVNVAMGTVASSSFAGPYRPWRSVLRTALGVEADAPDDTTMARVREALSERPGSEVFAPLVAEVLGVSLADNEWTSALVQQARVEKTRDVVIGLLNDAARAPLAIVLDNLHWMDSLSAGLALATFRRVTPLLLLVVTRPFANDAAPEAAELLDAPAVRILDLSRLSTDDVRRLMCQRLQVSHVPDELVALVEERAGGYPLFVGELVSSLLDAGVIEISGSTCALPENGARLRAHRLPDSVQGAIADRLDRLTPREQLTMKVASVIGAPVTSDAVAAVHPLHPDRALVESDLHALTERGFFTPSGNGRLSFGHAVMQDVAYALLLGEQRRALHRATAEWYARTQSAAVPSAVMAHHWVEAGDAAQSLDWLERAGEDASRLGGLRDTLRHFGRAFDVAAGDTRVTVSPARRARWLRFTGHAHGELGAMDESTTELTAALALMNQRLPAKSSAMGLRLGREALRQAGLLAGLLRCPARLTPAARRQTIEEAEVLRMLGKIAFYAQDHLRYITISLQSINLAERAGARDTAASAYAALGYIVAMLGLERLATRWWRLAEASGELDAQLNSLIGRMMYLNSHVRWKESEGFADEQAAILARVGTSLSMPSHLMIRGYHHLHHGRYAEGVAVVEQFLNWGLAANHLQQVFATHLQLAGLWIERGRLTEARRHLADAEALAPRVGDPLFLSIYHGIAVEVCLLSGDLDAAAAPAAALREVIAKAPPYFGDMVGYVALTRYGLARWRKAPTGAAASAIRTETRWAHSALKKHASLNPYARPRTWLLDGMIAACEGKFRRAHRRWLRALGVAERSDMPREIAYAHATLARWSRLPRDQRLRHRDDARTRFVAMGSEHLVAELTDLPGS